MDNEIESEQHSLAVKAKRALTDLTQTEGWRIMAQFMKARIDERTNWIMFSNPTESKLTKDQEVFMRGEAAAYFYMLNFPGLEIETNDAVVKALANGGYPDSDSGSGAANGGDDSESRDEA